MAGPRDTVRCADGGQKLHDNHYDYNMQVEPTQYNRSGTVTQSQTQSGDMSHKRYRKFNPIISGETGTAAGNITISSTRVARSVTPLAGQGLAAGGLIKTETETICTIVYPPSPIAIYMIKFG